MITITLRTIIIYLILTGGMRLAGKRQIGELQLSELVTALLLSELAALPVTDTDIPLVYSVIPIVLLLCIEIILPAVTERFPSLKRIIDGFPGIVVNRGVIDQGELSRARISIDELLSGIRQNGLGDINDAYYVIVEQNGRLSVIEKSGDSSSGDSSSCAVEKGLAHPVIMNGRFSPYNLTITGLSEDDVTAELSASGYSLPDILLFTVNDAGEKNIIPKEKK